MRLYYDLHIHSCLSPCAADEMTPGDICAMARLKGLDLIAVTDHNSAGNLPAVAACARREGLLPVPGLEVCTREEVHVLCYFAAVEAALAMGGWCRARLPAMRNRPDHFGRQLLMDECDRVTGEEDALLIGALSAGLSEVCLQARALGGVPVPAHVNRGSYGILTALGFLPPQERFTSLEADPSLPLPMDVTGLRVLHGSDAHRLGDIAERGESVELPRDAGAVLRWLASPAD